LTGERDMLQGDIKQRLIVHRFHTDIWDALVAQGSVDQLMEPDTVTTCYQRLRETNEMFEKFNEVGDVILHSPLINREGNDYGREHIIEILQEMCEIAEDVLYEAHVSVDQQLSRTCPECGTMFQTADACDAHYDQEHTTSTAARADQ
jgi:hypothetical protein